MVRQVKKRQVPYSLIKGLSVVQVGAPYDTLNAGRSRGMMFSLMAGERGKVLIVEPLQESVDEFRRRLLELKLSNTAVHHAGAWSSKTESVINVDAAHPATNFTSDTVDYSEDRISEFSQVKIQLDTLDNIFAQNKLDRVDLVSITTNWAEEEILKGLESTLAHGVKYVCLAYGKNGEDYSEQMEQMGYFALSHDDRGVTYQRKVNEE